MYFVTGLPPEGVGEASTADTESDGDDKADGDDD